ncbi:hypothetical protein HMPREF0569_1784 [Micrococcus luteus SK58]|nr:hypothetical protein HMPREF0569_1784 [Micrococcus luteus SK58]
MARVEAGHGTAVQLLAGQRQGQRRCGGAVGRRRGAGSHASRLATRLRCARRRGRAFRA